jgi:hypothetical protein
LLGAVFCSSVLIVPRPCTRRLSPRNYTKIYSMLLLYFCNKDKKIQHTLNQRRRLPILEKIAAETQKIGPNMPGKKAI